MYKKIALKDSDIKQNTPKVTGQVLKRIQEKKEKKYGVTLFLFTLDVKTIM